MFEYISLQGMMFFAPAITLIGYLVFGGLASWCSMCSDGAFGTKAITYLQENFESAAGTCIFFQIFTVPATTIPFFAFVDKGERSFEGFLEFGGSLWIPIVTLGVSFLIVGTVISFITKWFKQG